MQENKRVNFKNKIFNGMFVLVIRDFFLKIVSFFGQIVIVSLISPEYFGVFAIIIFIVGLSELFGDLGLTNLIIQKKRTLSKIQLSTIFFLKIILSCFSIFLLIISFPLIKHFYKQLTDENFLMTVILGFSILIRSITGISVAFLDKELNFTVVSKANLVGILVYTVVSVALAYYKFYLWNFIFAILC